MADKRRILIVDDEQDILEIFREILNRLPSNPEIVTASSGAVAVTELENGHFDLLLVDLRMPHMDGFQVLAIVRRRYPSLRVVVVTAVQDEEFRARAYAMGVDLYIEKPQTGKEIIAFVDCIESLLERDARSGFRGIQRKNLIDLIQLECLTLSSVVLRVTTALHEGKIWIIKGDIYDAVSGEHAGKEALVEMLRWKSGVFELLPADFSHARTIHTSYEGLLMETAQILDESAAVSATQSGAGLAGLVSVKGVQSAVIVDAQNPNDFDQWSAENPEKIAAWMQATAASAAALGDQLVGGTFENLECLGLQRHLAVSASDSQCLGVTFTRSASLHQIREAMKQIEVKWAS